MVLFNAKPYFQLVNHFRVCEKCVKSGAKNAVLGGGGGETRLLTNVVVISC